MGGGSSSLGALSSAGPQVCSAAGRAATVPRVSTTQEVMVPLAGSSFPRSADELAAAVAAALAGVLALDGGRAPVTVAGGTYPAVATVSVNVDGAAVPAGSRPPDLSAVGPREPGVTVGRLDVSGRPLRYEQANLNLTVSGTGLTFDFGRDALGRPLLLLTDADHGTVEVAIGKADLRAVLLAAAAAGGKEQGVTIQDLQVDLSSDGPRSAAATVRVKAKKMMMSGTVTVTGRVDVDDDLNATVSNLACKGEGMVGSVAAGLIGKHVQPYDGMTVSLMATSLGDVKLRDLTITVGDAVRVTAAFGKGE